VQTAAAAAGVSPRTAHRRLTDPSFRAEVDRARTDLIRQATGVLAGTATAAARELESLLDHPSGRVRLAAARAVLSLLPGLDSYASTVARLDALERLLTDDATTES